MNLTGKVDLVNCMSTILPISFRSVSCNSLTHTYLFVFSKSKEAEGEEDNCEFRLLSDVDSNSEKVSENMRFWCLRQ